MEGTSHVHLLWCEPSLPRRCVRTECSCLVARSSVPQRNFAELKKQYELYSDLGSMTASILGASLSSQADEANVSGLPSRGYHSDGDIVGARGTATEQYHKYTRAPQDGARGDASSGGVV